MMKFRTILILVFATVAIHGVAPGQDVEQYVNFESPQVKPIATFVHNGQDFLAVCNTPRNRLEIFAIGAGSTPVLTPQASIPTGLEPISVFVRPNLVDGATILYTCNWIGDSLTRVVARTAGSNVVFEFDRTVRVGDEPMAIAFMPQWGNAGSQELTDTSPGGAFRDELLVVFGQAGNWGWFNADTIAPRDAELPELMNATLLDSPQGERYFTAVQAGRMIGFERGSTSTPRLYVLNQRGGQNGTETAAVRGTTDLTPYDLDLWISGNPFTSRTTGRATANVAAGAVDGTIGAIGTTNLNMAFASNGDVWVVGTKARNLDLPIGDPAGVVLGGPAHAAQVPNGGFAQSFLARYRPTSAVPELLVFGLNAAQLDECSQPTDVVVYERNGQTRIICAGFNSDTIAIVTPNAGTSGTAVLAATTQFVNVASAASFSATLTSGQMHGPRGLAIRMGATAADDVLFVLNSIDNTVTSIALGTGALPTSPTLGASLIDPRPAYVRNGRKFLYSSKLSNGNTVSCATCHVDGHTDQIDWNLADGTPASQAAFPGSLAPNPATQKGPMVTQSLRGLVNFEIENAGFQDVFFSNRPYHWRGDRGDFVDFNEAFVSLMGLPPFAPPVAPQPPQGISATDMNIFKRFVNSIHYPPNPEQPIGRTFSGSFVGPNPNSPPAVEANTMSTGSRAQRGSKLFRGQPYVKVNSPSGFGQCITCHTGVEGSDNRLTEVEVGFLSPSNDPAAAALNDTTSPPVPASSQRSQNIETAQLKGLVEKEKRLRRRDPLTSALVEPKSSGVPVTVPVVTGNVGLIHTGSQTMSNLPTVGSTSIREFIEGFRIAGAFNPLLLGTTDVDDLTLYMREFDSGLSPSVGFAGTGTAGNPPNLATAEAFSAAANCGLVVLVRVPFVQSGQTLTEIHGLVFDPHANIYREMTSTSGGFIVPLGNLTRTALLSLLGTAQAPVVADRIAFECVPLGCERRCADTFGGPTSVSTLTPNPTNVTPGLVTTVEMIPNTAQRLLPLITTGFVGTATDALFFSPTSTSPNAIEIVFQALMMSGGSQNFGLSNFRFDVSRRFRVRASNVVPGAKLRLTMPLASDVAGITTLNGSPTTGTLTPAHAITFEFPIYPGLDPQGQPVWETAVEIEPNLYYGMMTGASFNPFALLSMFAVQPNPPALLNTIQSNFVFAEIVNPGGITAPQTAANWRRIILL